MASSAFMPAAAGLLSMSVIRVCAREVSLGGGPVSHARSRKNFVRREKFSAVRPVVGEQRRADEPDGEKGAEHEVDADGPGTGDGGGVRARLSRAQRGDGAAR